ncbi:integrase catalytic domain-containing protein [Trichonephila clavipes]|nr:integrase catalytic domain-containing protein [Trichonephila clavipes]
MLLVGFRFETKLGNTVIGMQDDVCHIDRNVMTTLSMYVRNIKLTDLWSLENLGISNPTLEESKQNSYEDALDDFQQKLTILPNGRVHVEKETFRTISSDDRENAERVLIRSEPVSLPADRVKDANAFDITGIDLAGPLFTRDGGKVWMVLYTCAIYRANTSRARKNILVNYVKKRPGKPGHDVKVGDVVMIEEPSKKRIGL